jgi:hypothetical protein
VFDVEVLARPWMADDGRRYPPVDGPVHAVPRQVVPLAKPAQRPEPDLDNMVSERRQAAPVRRHGAVGEVVRHDAFQPLSLIGDALVPAASQFFFDLRKFWPAAVCAYSASGIGTGRPRVSAQMRVSPKKSKVSGRPRPWRLRFASANWPKAIRGFSPDVRSAQKL